jgi:hypothetical protein
MDAFVVTSTYPPDHLFSEIGPPQMPDAQAAAGTAIVWEVTLNQTLLATLPSSLVLNLPDHAPVTLDMDQAESRGSGAYVWGGRGGDCSAVFTAGSHQLLGDISCINGPYTVKMTASGTRLSFFVYGPPPAGFDDDVAVLDEGMNMPAGECEPQQSSGDSSTILDVLVLYNAAVRQEIENEGLNPQLAMQAIMDSVQQAMINSRSADAQTPKVSLVHAEEIAYAATGSMEDDLIYLRNDSIPTTLRNQSGADIVMLVRKDVWQGNCGLAYSPGYQGTPLPGPAFAPLAVGTTVRTCGFAKYPFHHEFAHILGANHSEPASNPTPVRCWAFAKYQSTVKAEARTLVSNRAPCGTFCAQVLNYSNADITVDWFRTGVPNEAENARVIAEFASAAAAYRDSVDQIFADGFDL